MSEIKIHPYYSLNQLQSQFLFWIMSTYILAETEEKEGKEGEEDLDNSYWEPWILFIYILDYVGDRQTYTWYFQYLT